MRERVAYLRRLAFWTITEQDTDQSDLFHLTGSKAEDIDVVLSVDEVDVEKQRQALDFYVTYQSTIKEAGVRRNIPREAVFEIYQEAHDPPLESLSDGLTANGASGLLHTSTYGTMGPHYGPVPAITLRRHVVSTALHSRSRSRTHPSRMSGSGSAVLRGHDRDLQVGME